MNNANAHGYTTTRHDGHAAAAATAVCVPVLPDVLVGTTGTHSIPGTW